MSRTRKSSAIAKAIDNLKVALDSLMQLQDSYEVLLADVEAYTKVKPLVASLNRELNPTPATPAESEEPPATEQPTKRERRKKENAGEPLAQGETGEMAEPSESDQERQE